MNGVFASLDIEDSDLRAHASHRMPGDARATDWRLSVLIDFKDDTALPVAIPQPAIIDDSLSRLQSLQQKRNGLFVWKLLGGFLIGLGVFCWFEAEGLNGVFGILIIYLGQICYNHGDKLVSATRKSPLSLGSISRRMKLKFAWTALSFCLIGLGILCLYGVAILGVEPINQAWIFVALVYLGTVCLRPKIHVSLSFLEKSARLAGKAFGIVLIALSGLGLVEPLLRGPGSVLFAAASFPCFYLAKTCYVRAKKMGGMDALEALASDPRKPVLYLRPFREDELAAQRGKTFLRLRSEEEALAKVMNEIGPFICVGKPNESLSEVGAFRMYMSEEKWQEKVRDLMDRAQLVVLRVGWTDGFLWEVAQMTQSDSPQRVVLLITGTKEDYEAFRKMTQAYFPYPLPEYGVDMNRPLFGNGGLSSLRGFVHFDQDWIPHYVSLATVKQPWKYIPRTLGEGKLVKRLRWGLRPFLQKDGMAPKLPPIRWTATVILGIACRAVIMSLLRFYSLWIANG